MFSHMPPSHQVISVASDLPCYDGFMTSSPSPDWPEIAWLLVDMPQSNTAPAWIQWVTDQALARLETSEIDPDWRHPGTGERLGPAALHTWQKVAKANGSNNDFKLHAMAVPSALLARGLDLLRDTSSRTIKNYEIELYKHPEVLPLLLENARQDSFVVRQELLDKLFARSVSQADGVALMEICLAAGVDPSLNADNGPAWFQAKNPTIVARLLDLGVDPESGSADGSTYERAVRDSLPEISQVLAQFRTPEQNEHARAAALFNKVSVICKSTPDFVGELLAKPWPLAPHPGLKGTRNQVAWGPLSAIALSTSATNNQPLLNACLSNRAPEWVRTRQSVPGSSDLTIAALSLTARPMLQDPRPRSKRARNAASAWSHTYQRCQPKSAFLK
jgi:hypothetical protein